MVWAIGPRLILSKAQKSAGTNGPNHAGRVLVGLVMEISSGAQAGGSAGDRMNDNFSPYEYELKARCRT